MSKDGRLMLSIVQPFRWLKIENQPKSVQQENNYPTHRPFLILLVVIRVAGEMEILADARGKGHPWTGHQFSHSHSKRCSISCLDMQHLSLLTFLFCG